MLSAAAVLAAAAAAERTVRGEPRTWDEMSEAEQEEGGWVDGWPLCFKLQLPHIQAGKFSLQAVQGPGRAHIVWCVCGTWRGWA